MDNIKLNEKIIEQRYKISRSEEEARTLKGKAKTKRKVGQMSFTVRVYGGWKKDGDGRGNNNKHSYQCMRTELRDEMWEKWYDTRGKWEKVKSSDTVEYVEYVRFYVGKAKRKENRRKDKEAIQRKMEEEVLSSLQNRTTPTTSQTFTSFGLPQQDQSTNMNHQSQSKRYRPTPPPRKEVTITQPSPKTIVRVDKTSERTSIRRIPEAKKRKRSK